MGNPVNDFGLEAFLSISRVATHLFLSPLIIIEHEIFSSDNSVLNLSRRFLEEKLNDSFAGMDSNLDYSSQYFGPL